MIKLFIAALAITTAANAQSKKKERLFKGMYIQWGYNTEWYTRSTLHFKMSNRNDFKVYHAQAKDRPDLDAIPEKPFDVSIPQYNYRIGFYLNEQHSKIVEINFDHAKYIVTDNQTVRVKGKIDGIQVDADSILNPASFLHFEHTDGANWLHFNYAKQRGFGQSKLKTRNIFTYIWKVGIGINIPRTDFTWRGDRLNNRFHIAGYNISAEAGVRYYPFKKLFIECTGKTGFVRYVNALVNTHFDVGSRASHSFGYFELIGTLGYDIKF